MSLFSLIYINILSHKAKQTLAISAGDVRGHLSTLTRLPFLRVAHYEYMALAKNTSVLHEATLCIFEPRRDVL